MSARLKEKNLAGNWKGKYLQSLNELNEIKKTWKNEENNLYKSILRLVLTYSGLDPELDKQFNSMRKNLRKGAVGEKRKQIIDKIIEQTLEYTQDSKKLNPTEENSKLLIGLIKELDLAEQLNPERNKLIKSISKSPDAEKIKKYYKDAALIINRAFIAKGIEGRDEQNPGSVEIKEEDVFEVFLNRLSLPGEIGIEISSLRNRLKILHATQDKLGLVDELIQFLQSLYRENLNNTLDTSDFEHLKEPLFQLIEWLPISTQYDKKIEDIKNKLAELCEEKELLTVFRRIAELVNDFQSSLQDELIETQNFLKNITLRLEGIDKHIHNIAISEEESKNNSESLSESVHTNVRTIREDIKEADNIEIIKQNISQRLMDIEISMGDYIQIESIRREATEQEIQTLNERIKELKTETITLEQRIREEQGKAHVDALTKIPNRLAFNERIQEEVNRWQRYDHPLSICVIDVDKFKNVNDKFGHRAGDKVLVTVAELCASRIRESDFFARYGGEEFVLILPDTTLSQAIAVAENLRKEVDNCTYHYAKDPVPITVSCGLASFAKGDAEETVFSRADKALYKAKEAGRNQSKSENDL